MAVLVKGRSIFEVIDAVMEDFNHFDIVSATAVLPFWGRFGSKFHEGDNVNCEGVEFLACLSKLVSEEVDLGL